MDESQTYSPFCSVLLREWQRMTSRRLYFGVCIIPGNSPGSSSVILIDNTDRNIFHLSVAKNRSHKEKSTKQTGSYDLRTFEIHARPTQKVDDLRPGMSVLLRYICNECSVHFKLWHQIFPYVKNDMYIIHNHQVHNGSSRRNQLSASMVDAARSTVDEVSALLVDSRLTAPENGQIATIFPKRGELVAPV